MTGTEKRDPEAIISIRDLTKRYGQKTAVDRLSLDIRRGEVFGLLGPNGAGKTTTTLMLTGLTEPSGGSARIDGLDCIRDSIRVRRIVGYLPDNVGFYNDLTGRENLRFTAALNGMPEKQVEEEIDRLLLRTGLSGAGDQRVGTYSRGMRQRLGVADVLLKDPKVIIMDEPTLGIDPEGMRQLLSLIRELAKTDGRTILLSSHQLYQVQQVCDRVGMFVEGRLLACGTIGELAKELAADSSVLLEIEVDPSEGDLRSVLQELPEIQSVGREEDRYVISAGRDIGNELLSAAIAAGCRIQSMRHLNNDLEEIYRRYFEKAEQEHDKHQNNKRFISRNFERKAAGAEKK